MLRKPFERTSALCCSDLDSQLERDIPDGAERRIQPSLCQVLLRHQVSQSLLKR